jgi:trimethylamine-N-oxide reductase (cytochrome c)
MQNVNQDNKNYQNGISRRTFLALTGMTGLAGLLSPSLLTSAWSATGESEAFSSHFFGPFKAKVKDGRIVSTVAWEKCLYPNEVQARMADYVYSPARIKYPMVRKSYLSGGPGANREARGSDGFVRVNWDEATQLIAKEFKRIMADHGNSSILLDGGWNFQSRIQGAKACGARVTNLLGGVTGTVADYSTGAVSQVMPYVTGSTEVYGRQTSYPMIQKNAEVLVFWGCDPMVTLRIGMGSTLGYGLDYLKKLKGKKIIVIDPRNTETARGLGAEWVAPRPNTDMAIMLAMAFTMHKEGMANKEFLDEYTVGYDKFVPYLLGETDKTPKTPEWAEAISGISAAKIKEIARLIAQKPSMLFSGWSMQRADHGEQPLWMVVVLACMAGQIGLPGCGYSLGHLFNDGGVPWGTSPGVAGISPGKPPKGAPPPLQISRIVDALLNPGKTITFKGGKMTYPDLKMLYYNSGNPQNRHQDRNQNIEAWRKPDTIVAHAAFWTSTAWLSDIVLPICTPLEWDDIYFDTNRRYIIPIKKAVEPLYESKSSYDAFAAVAKALGIESKYTEGKTALNRVEEAYNASRNRAKGVAMPSFQEFWKKGEPLEFPLDPKGETFTLHQAYRDDPLLEPMGTASGKIEIYSKDIEKMGHAECGPHPAWYEPFEWLGSPKAKKYPLHLLTCHPKYRLHNQFNHVKSLRKFYTVADREPMEIHPDDAKARGIKDGDIVRMFSERGEVLVGAKVTSNIMPGVVKVSEGGWYDPVERGKIGSLGKYGNANLVIKDKPTSGFAQSCNGNTALVQVEKYTGAAPKVTAFDGPPAV